MITVTIQIEVVNPRLLRAFCSGFMSDTATDAERAKEIIERSAWLGSPDGSITGLRIIRTTAEGA